MTDEAESTFQVEPLLSIENVKIIQGSMLAGLLCGYGSGFVGPYSTMYDMSTNCSLYMSATSCSTLSNAKCYWTGDREQPCAWREEVNCFQTYHDSSSCSSDTACSWSYKEDVCRNMHGYSTLQSGLFAGSMVLGCMSSTVVSGLLCRAVGVKKLFLISGCCGLVGCIGYHLSTAFALFWLLVVSRVCIGFANGFCTIAASLYVNTNAHPRHAPSLGLMFQIFTCLGILVAAVVAVLVGQTVDYSSHESADLKGRMQAFSSVATFISVLMIGLGFWLPKGKAIAGTADDNQDDGVDMKRYTYWQMMPRLLIGIVAAGTLQLTGINAVMNFAPTMMEIVGMQPLVGNVVIMIWNFIATCLSVPLMSLTSLRPLFLVSSVGASLACILLCGVPVIPGVASTEVKNGVGITGIMVFIALYEFGVGPSFYVLAQDLFPVSFRPQGASFCNAVQFFFTLLVTSMYSVATTAISGGPSGNQDKGQAAAFIFFGAVGLVCFVVEVFFLFPWVEKEDPTDDLQAMAASGYSVEQQGDATGPLLHGAIASKSVGSESNGTTSPS